MRGTDSRDNYIFVCQRQMKRQDEMYLLSRHILVLLFQTDRTLSVANRATVSLACETVSWTIQGPDENLLSCL